MEPRLRVIANIRKDFPGKNVEIIRFDNSQKAWVIKSKTTVRFLNMETEAYMRFYYIPGKDLIPITTEPIEVIEESCAHSINLTINI